MTGFILRICRTCGHVGCCDQSKNKHATKHFHRSKHPIIEGYDPPEGWGWCYVDEVMFDLATECDAAERPDPALLLSPCGVLSQGYNSPNKVAGFS